ncbi:hypothetical protein CEXT_221611 [Caerostris extrusa]|uniref:Ycf15 n=1 Tax=Caerostris extrusa TaxID=172846 RepID=A0AAV4QCI4_CAEEX|nr:hypothetical protein CEXT_221611 [Caerostris extrusa]
MFGALLIIERTPALQVYLQWNHCPLSRNKSPSAKLNFAPNAPFVEMGPSRLPASEEKLKASTFIRTRRDTALSSLSLSL